MSKDFLHNIRHAKRQTISMDDLRLVLRRNPKLVKVHARCSTPYLIACLGVCLERRQAVDVDIAFLKFNFFI